MKITILIVIFLYIKIQIIKSLINLNGDELVVNTISS